MYYTFREVIDTVIKNYSTKNALTYMRDSGKDDKVTFEQLGFFINNSIQVWMVFSGE